ncbi:type II toxin-antitoxin system RelE/ParE family toxin [Terracidiphilus gabretensis]|uniref:type II toxin-antitoxin system RelE/ParE family toxin n=1 Tax=Terracidiphilus gabretensis TaxID=1577687 RepID=UPI0009E980FC
MKTRWSLPAVNELNHIFQYIASDNEEAAHRVMERIGVTIERASRMPYSARAGRHPRIRELVVPGTPYIVVYEIAKDSICIATILRGAQNRS